MNVHGKCGDYIINNPGVVWDTLVNIPINVPDYSTFVFRSSTQSTFVIIFNSYYKNHLSSVV